MFAGVVPVLVFVAPEKVAVVEPCVVDVVPVMILPPPVGDVDVAVFPSLIGPEGAAQSREVGLRQLKGVNVTLNTTLT